MYLFGVAASGECTLMAGAWLQAGMLRVQGVSVDCSAGTCEAAWCMRSASSNALSALPLRPAACPSHALCSTRPLAQLGHRGAALLERHLPGQHMADREDQPVQVRCQVSSVQDGC